MKRLFILVFIFISVLTFQNVNAQCSVCRAGAESSVEQGYKAGKGLNKGILYLMAVPYIMVGAGFYFFYSKIKKKETKEG